MNKNLEWLTEKDTVLQAATVMAEAGVGFLPICDVHQRVVGVVTDRDLTTRALAKRIAPETTSAALIMSSPAVTCLETADIAEAEDLMAVERKSRIVITDADGKLTGVVSLADLVEQVRGRKSLETVRAVLWREALGPRAGAPKGQPLLKDDPIARQQPKPDDEIRLSSSVAVGGHHAIDTKEFPG
jgi:signal-transduction protein with cAMP-binding, CBS, and nucleotidyltransferase domain